MSDISIVSAMFEEIKQFLKRIDTKVSKEEIDQQVNTDDVTEAALAGLKDIIDRSEDNILSGMEELKQSFKNEKRKVEHKTFNIKSSWVFLTMTGLVMLLIIALCLFYKQWEQNGRLKDNDLKYRYVLMKSGLTAGKIEWLEESFPANKDSIQSKVLEYEDHVRKQAKAIIQNQLNEEEMKNLNEKIEQLQK